MIIWIIYYGNFLLISSFLFLGIFNFPNLKTHQKTIKFALRTVQFILLFFWRPHRKAIKLNKNQGVNKMEICIEIDCRSESQLKEFSISYHRTFEQTSFP
jgi:hypothetical protein